MIQSMTGYGKASAEFQGKKINAEVKSLNSKALDLSTRLAPIYREKEMEVRVLIAQALERGKVEFNLWIEQTEAQNAASINGELVANYYKQITDIAEKYDIDEPEDIWTVLMRMPDVLSKTEIQELTDEEWAVAKSVVEKAIQQLVDFRIQEGRALQKKFEEKLNNIATLLASIEPFETSRTEKIRQRLVDALQAIPEVEYDRNRLEQEMILRLCRIQLSFQRAL